MVAPDVSVDYRHSTPEVLARNGFPLSNVRPLGLPAPVATCSRCASRRWVMTSYDGLVCALCGCPDSAAFPSIWLGVSGA